jgi:hypothetical protein
MRSFLDTPELVEATPEQFRNGLDRFHVRAVCLVNTAKADAARTILRQDGFHRTLSRADYELWVRSGAELNTLRGGDGEVCAVSWSVDGSRIASNKNTPKGR